MTLRQPFLQARWQQQVLIGQITRVQISCLSTFPALRTLGIARP
jgi:hypothetical protein